MRPLAKFHKISISSKQVLSDNALLANPSEVHAYKEV
jgi:hypothetical protein